MGIQILCVMFVDSLYEKYSNNQKSKKITNVKYSDNNGNTILNLNQLMLKNVIHKLVLSNDRYP